MSQFLWTFSDKICVSQLWLKLQPRNMRFFFYVPLVFQLLNCVFGTENIGCRDESGNLIDWFYLYKLPNTYSGQRSERNVQSGFKYLFVTPSVTSKWVLSKKFVNDSASMPGRTLAEVYQGTNKEDNLVMMYNDEPPNDKTDGSRGHTKGVLVGNTLGGFWMIHSVPKFPPPLEESYGFPSTGSLYGQSFLCISMNQEQLATVGKQLQFNEPHFYSSQVPENLKTLVKISQANENLLTF